MESSSTAKTTYTEPNQHTLGMQHVLINGTSVISDGQLDANVFPVQPVRRPVIASSVGQLKLDNLARVADGARSRRRPAGNHASFSSTLSDSSWSGTFTSGSRQILPGKFCYLAGAGA